jgi:hypothetical protein
MDITAASTQSDARAPVLRRIACMLTRLFPRCIPVFAAGSELSVVDPERGLPQLSQLTNTAVPQQP